MNTNLLVTGGCGFIGSNFIRVALQARPNWRLVNLDALTYAGNMANLHDLKDDRRYHFIHGDICNQALVASILREHRIDMVVHFAAESHVDRSIVGPDAFVRTNINGAFALLEAARNYWLEEKIEPGARRFLQVSTDEVFGSLGSQGYFTESSSYAPRSPYSASKAAADHLAQAYFHTYGLPVLLTNCSNNYGPYQFPEKLIPLMLNNALKGELLPLYGDGGNVRDWLYVIDHCEAIIKVLEQGRVGESYLIGGHNERTNKQIVELLCDLLDRRCGLLPGGAARRSLIRFVADRPGHDRRYAIDPIKISRELNWQPRFSFDAGMEATIDWYLSNQAWLVQVLDGSYQRYYQSMYAHRKASAK